MVQDGCLGIPRKITKNLFLDKWKPTSVISLLTHCVGLNARSGCAAVTFLMFSSCLSPLILNGEHEDASYSIETFLVP